MHGGGRIHCVARHLRRHVLPAVRGTNARAGQGSGGRRSTCDEQVHAASKGRLAAAADHRLRLPPLAPLAGGVVAGELLMLIIKARTNNDDCANGFILDGFPRTVGQAEALDKMLVSEGAGKLSAVIEFKIPDEVLVERICGRWVHKASGRSYHVKFNPPKSLNPATEPTPSTPLAATLTAGQQPQYALVHALAFSYRSHLQLRSLSSSSSAGSSKIVCFTPSVAIRPSTPPVALLRLASLSPRVCPSSSHLSSTRSRFTCKRPGELNERKQSAANE